MDSGYTGPGVLIGLIGFARLRLAWPSTIGTNTFPVGISLLLTEIEVFS